MMTHRRPELSVRARVALMAGLAAVGLAGFHLWDLVVR